MSKSIQVAGPDIACSIPRQAIITPTHLHAVAKSHVRPEIIGPKVVIIIYSMQSPAELMMPPENRRRRVRACVSLPSRAQRAFSLCNRENNV